MQRISIVGLGKLGLPMATLYAQAGHQVIGVDKNQETIHKTMIRHPTLAEPGLRALMRTIPPANLTATTDIRQAVLDTDTTLIIVPSPSDENGRFSNQYVLEAINEIGHAISEKDTYHLVVVCSTLMPGSTEGPIRYALEKFSARKVGEQLGLCYSPEFIALGSVIHDMQYPDMVLIGGVGAKDRFLLHDLSKTVVKNRPHYAFMSPTEAEIAKIGVNAYVTMKLSYANTLGEICEQIPNVDGQKIADAIGHDSRIGTKYIRPGAPFGGPCFPRDSRAFGAFGEDYNANMTLSASVDQVNRRQIELMIERIIRTGKRKVGIYGLAYKAHTPVLEEAFGYQLMQRLTELGYLVKMWDPNILPDRNWPEVLARKAFWVDSGSVGCDNETVIVLTTPEEQFKEIFPDVWKEHPGTFVIDCWNLVPEGPWDTTHVVRLGVGPKENDAVA